MFFSASRKAKKSKKYLRSTAGITLVEVMMAVTVFGIILLFMTQMTNTSSRITSLTNDQVRIIELARAEAERIRSGKDFTAEQYREAGYPPAEEDPQKKYALTIYTENASGGTLIKIVTGPAGVEPLDPANPENYVLVTWLPYAINP